MITDPAPAALSHTHAHKTEPLHGPPLTVPYQKGIILTS